MQFDDHQIPSRVEVAAEFTPPEEVIIVGDLMA